MDPRLHCTVRVRAPTRPHPTQTYPSQAILEVEDNGPGIPPSARASAVSRFARGQTEGPGMGLGLPVVEEIATLFGGHLVLDEGAEGRGLLARIVFPAVT